MQDNRPKFKPKRSKLINIIEKVSKTRTQKTPAKELYESKAQVNKKRKDIKLLVICSYIPHSQVSNHVVTGQLNFDKIQITDFRKTRNNRAGNLRTDSGNKSQ